MDTIDGGYRGVDGLIYISELGLLVATTHFQNGQPLGAIVVKKDGENVWQVIDSGCVFFFHSFFAKFCTLPPAASRA